MHGRKVGRRRGRLPSVVLGNPSVYDGVCEILAGVPIYHKVGKRQSHGGWEWRTQWKLKSKCVE